MMRFQGYTSDTMKPVLAVISSLLSNRLALKDYWAKPALSSQSTDKVKMNFEDRSGGCFVRLRPQKYRQTLLSSHLLSKWFYSVPWLTGCLRQVWLYWICISRDFKLALFLCNLWSLKRCCKFIFLNTTRAQEARLNSSSALKIKSGQCI